MESIFVLVLLALVFYALRMKAKKTINPFFLYADAQPSEAIQADEFPGLTVACIFPYKEGERFFNVPVKQYKHYDKKKKADRAIRLKKWLESERKNGLVIKGFMLSRSLEAAAKYGLDLIEELPDTHVKPHYGKHRLYFGDENISFSQSIALMYYSFVLYFSVQRASTRMKDGQKYMTIFLDKFPGTSSGDLKPGEIPTEKSQGMKFVEFVRARSATSVGIDKENEENGIFYKTDMLLWWRHSDGDQWVEGKKHPHFTLVDWLVASARVKSFKDEFVKTFSNTQQGEQAAQALCELYDEFKKFDVWEVADDNTLAHITSKEKLWKVPDDARKYILAKANNK